jgi:hypothetical protein
VIITSSLGHGDRINTNTPLIMKSLLVIICSCLGHGNTKDLDTLQIVEALLGDYK